MQNTERSTNIVEEKDGEGEGKEGRRGGDGSDKTMKVPMGQGKDGE